MLSIEAARALAALSVVLMHAANLMRVEHFSGHVGLGGIFDFGYIGVDFFFVLSGFIITYVHYREIGHPQRIGRYFWRRFSRIYPIYWAVLSIAIAVSLAGRWMLGKEAEFQLTPQDIAGTVFLLMSGGGPKYVGVAWSLQYEVVFYVAFCALLIHARFGTLLYVAWAAFAILTSAGLIPGGAPFGLDDAHCLQFLLGVAVGVTARRYSLSASLPMLFGALAMLGGAAALEVYGPFGRHGPVGRVALGLASAAVLLALLGLENTRRLKTPLWLARLGSVSYSVYLGHVIFINLTYMVLSKLGIYERMPEALVFATAVATALLCTTLIGYGIELPLVEWLKNQWREIPPVRAAQAARPS